MKDENNFENLKKLGNAADSFIGNMFHGVGAIVITGFLLLFAAAGFRIVVWLFEKFTGVF